jgi:hypothetical protein
MSRLICFIDKEGFCGTRSEEAMGKDTIDCSKCDFKKKFEGKEKKEFIYCMWKGELKN